MIETRKSGAKYSAIVGIGENLRQRSIQENREYLLLNRGINAVVNIDIKDIAKEIDFNSNDIQVYPPAKGRPKLREAINEAYFHGATTPDNIFITNGGVSALELIFKTLNTKEVVLPPFYWGAYLNVLKINKLPFSFYNSLEEIASATEKLKGKAVLICDPNNPTGSKLNDSNLLETINILNNSGIVTIVDSPYRRLFYDWKTDGFYKGICDLENIIISESFSKSIGLSGQRIGFVHCRNEEFMQELGTNLLYATNGINNFSQILVEKILTEEKGIKAAIEFRDKTVNEIKKNIQYLSEKNMLAKEFYGAEVPWGIFVIVNKSYETLLQYQIGSVPLNYFSQLPIEEASKYARICVSIPHEKFKTFFDKIA